MTKIFAKSKSNSMAKANQNKTDEALQLSKNAIALADSVNQPMITQQAYSSMGFVLKSQQKWNEAIPYYEKAMASLAEWLGATVFFDANPKDFNFVSSMVKPLQKATNWVLGSLFGMEDTARGLVMASVAVVLLFTALFLLVKILRGLLKDRLAGLFSKTLFRHPAISFVVGLFTTAAVQSSSVTTSLVVPLVGAGVLKIKQIFPYTLGANIGTTVTAMLAALAGIASPEPGFEHAAAMGLAVALGHLLFNVFGTVVFWPLQWIPISLAKGYAKLASKRRILAAVYVIIIFFVLPILTLFLVNSQGFMSILTGSPVGTP